MAYSLYPCRLEVSEWLCCAVVSVHAYLVGRFERVNRVERIRFCFVYLLAYSLTCLLLLVHDYVNRPGRCLGNIGNDCELWAKLLTNL